jgi:hypothetical protein
MRIMILPGTGRWQAEGLTEGLAGLLQLSASPSTSLWPVPPPVPGRI